MLAASPTCCSPSRSTTALGDSPLSKTSASTVLALAADTFPPSTPLISSASPAGLKATAEALKAVPVVNSSLGCDPRRHHRVEVVGQGQVRGEDAGVIRREAKVLHVPGAPRGGQLGHPGTDLRHPLLGGSQRGQIGLGEVAVVVRLFLRALGHGPPLGLVPAAGLLHEPLAALQGIGLAGDLELHGTLERAERVQVLDLDLGAEGIGPHRSQADVALDSHRPGLHVAVRRADVPQDVAQGLAVGSRLGGAAHVGLGDDLYQGHSGPIEVEE